MTPHVNPRIARRSLTTAALFGALVLAGCNGDAAEIDPTEPPTVLGRQLYERKVEGISCADCHGAAEGDTLTMGAGHSLAGVSGRPRLWGGRFTGNDRVISASLWCAARYQYRTLADALAGGGPPDFSEVPLSNAERVGLTAYLASLDGPPDEVSTELDDDVEHVIGDLTGDPDRGEEVWRAACAVCHGAAADGAIGPTLSGKDAVDPFTLADYVRTGADDSVPEDWMPHFRKDRLSSQDLADLASRYAE